MDGVVFCAGTDNRIAGSFGCACAVCGVRVVSTAWYDGRMVQNARWTMGTGSVRVSVARRCMG